jgi:hypothetical protein
MEDLDIRFKDNKNGSFTDRYGVGDWMKVMLVDVAMLDFSEENNEHFEFHKTKYLKFSKKFCP